MFTASSWCSPRTSSGSSATTSSAASVSTRSLRQQPTISPRPIVGEDWFFDLLEDGAGRVVVASLAGVPPQRIGAQMAALQNRLDGLKTFCERAGGGPAEPHEPGAG